VRVREVLLHLKNGSLNVVKQVCRLVDWIRRTVQRAYERHIAALYDLDPQNLEVRVVASDGRLILNSSRRLADVYSDATALSTSPIASEQQVAVY
jgi:hypothetical protein